MTQKVLGLSFETNGAILFGPTGQGKTRLAWMLLKGIMERHPDWRVRIFDCISFAEDINDAIENRYLSTWLREVNGSNLIFFDDLGKLAMSERVESVLFGVVENIVAGKRRMLITTNWDSAIILSRFSAERGPAILRRIREHCTPVNFQKQTEKKVDAPKARQ